MTYLKHPYCLCVILGAVVLLLNTSCARTVTDKLVLGQEIQIEFQTRSAISLSATNYYILLSSSASPQPPNRTKYFTAPGQVFDEAALLNELLTIPQMYTNFFSSWSHYLLVKSTTAIPDLYTGPFPAGSSEATHSQFTRESSFSGQVTSSSTNYQCQFSIDQLGFTNTSTIFITFVTVDKTTGLVEDILETGSITLEKTNKETNTGVQDSGISGSADLTLWEVEIF